MCKKVSDLAEDGFPKTFLNLHENKCWNHNRDRKECLHNVMPVSNYNNTLKLHPTTTYLTIRWGYYQIGKHSTQIIQTYMQTTEFNISDSVQYAQETKPINIILPCTLLLLLSLPIWWNSGNVICAMHLLIYIVSIFHSTFSVSLKETSNVPTYMR